MSSKRTGGALSAFLRKFGEGLLKGGLVDIKELENGRVRLTAEYPSMAEGEFVLEQLYVVRALSREGDAGLREFARRYQEIVLAYRKRGGKHG
jgi:hypothetical protein